MGVGVGIPFFQQEVCDDRLDAVTAGALQVQQGRGRRNRGRWPVIVDGAVEMQVATKGPRNDCASQLTAKPLVTVGHDRPAVRVAMNKQRTRKTQTHG